MEKKLKRRFLTVELNPHMSDAEEAKFKQWIADGIRDLQFTDENTALCVPRKFLKFNNAATSKKIVVANQILKRK